MNRKIFVEMIRWRSYQNGLEKTLMLDIIYKYNFIKARKILQI